MTPSPTLFGEALNASLQVMSIFKLDLKYHFILWQFLLNYQAALAESNLNFLHRNQSSSQSPLDRHLNFHHHRHHHSLDASGLHEPPSNKRVKLEAPDEESNSSSCAKTADGAGASEEYFCRNTAGGSSLVVIKQQQLDAISSSGGGGGGASGTDNEDNDNNDASSTENYEPLDFKAWRSQRPPVTNSNDEDDDDDDYSIGRASLTVEVGPASSASRLVDANSAADYLTPAVHSAK